MSEDLYKQLIGRFDTLISHLEVLNNLIALNLVKDKKTPTERIGLLLGSGLKQSVIADLLWTKQNIVGAVKSNLEKQRRGRRIRRQRAAKKPRTKPAVGEKGAEESATNQPSVSSDIK